MLSLTAWLEQPPSWADPDHVNEETAMADAKAFMAAAAKSGNGVRTG